MKAAVLESIGSDFTFADIDVAEPEGVEVLIDVKASGLCHTDLTLSRHDLGIRVPAVYGHEVAGVVAAIGPDVRDLRVGDHVVACSIQSCGTCAKCTGGRTYLCSNPSFTLRSEGDAPRLSRDGKPVSQFFGIGGFAEQVLIHEHQLVAIDKEIDFAPAALLGCGVVTGAGAVLNSANVQQGDSVVVVGAGGVGLSAISGARIAGATRIIAIDIQEAKLERARRFGATDTINSSETDPAKAVLALTDGGVNHVFDFVGNKAVTEQGIRMLAHGGGLYLIGVSGTPSNFEVENFNTINNQIRIQGVIMGSSNFKADIPMYAELYRQGRMNLNELISKRISLGELNEGFAALSDPGTARVVITSF
jgi:S-(hydroxymethyl)glutathione dehydrogenase/alcohol dehydrogenase